MIIRGLDGKFYPAPKWLVERKEPEKPKFDWAKYNREYRAKHGRTR